MYSLYDNWNENGEDAEELRKLLEEIDSKTEYLSVNSSRIGLYSYLDSDEEGVSLKLACLEGEREYETALNLSEMTPDVSADYFRDKSPVAFIGDSDEKLICRNSTVRDVFSLFGISGAELLKCSAERDRFIARLLAEGKDMTLVIRGNGGGNRKIFSARSGSYCPGELSDIMKIYDSLKKADIGEIGMTSWRADQDTVAVEILFEEMAERIREKNGLPDLFVPGVRICNSGTGESSFRADFIWNVNGSVFSAGSVKKPHRGFVSAEKFAEECRETVRGSLGKLTDRMEELMSTAVVSGDESAEGVSGILESTVDRISSFIGLNDVFREKDREAISFTEQIKTLLISILTEMYGHYEGPLTAYDVATAFMQLPSRTIGVPKRYAGKFADACGRAPFANYVGKTE